MGIVVGAPGYPEPGEGDGLVAPIGLEEARRDARTAAALVVLDLHVVDARTQRIGLSVEDEGVVAPVVHRERVVDVDAGTVVAADQQNPRRGPSEGAGTCPSAR